jgi:septum formation protein
MTAGSEPRCLILASGSRARRQMLAAAGLSFSVMPASIDEAAVRAALLAKNVDAQPREIAAALAVAKAEAVSRAQPDALVIGSDQVLSLGNEIIDKSPDLDAARTTLRRLRGRSHELHSAVAIAGVGKFIWTHVETAELVMRDVSDAFLDDYLDRAGRAILDCVGCYEIEGLGIQLFERVEGDHHTILGMPLLPLLEQLRRWSAIGI